MRLLNKTTVSFLLGVSLLLPAPVRATAPHADPPPRTPLSRFERSLAPPRAESAESRPRAPSAGPMYWRDISKVAFQSYRDGNWEIYTANGEGTGESRVTNHAASDVLPRLNRGASRIVFSSGRDGNYEIYSVKTDGSDLRRLTNNSASDLYPFWSPDETRIAFASARAGNTEIYVMNADGTAVTRLTDNAASDSEPTWSPDGTKIAFISYRSAPANTGGRVWVMNADGSNPQQIGTTNFSFDPVWSPDGTKIGFDGDIDGDGWLDVLWMSAAGEAVTLLAPSYDYVPFENYMGGWSPDSAEIVYSFATWWPDSQGYYLHDVRTRHKGLQNGNAVWFTSTDVDMSPDWQGADLSPPTTAVQALPAVSPANFTVVWAGSATDGPATQFTYEIQSREGITGAWTSLATADWSAPNSRPYHGQGGRAYYFRSHGIDQLLNVEPWPADYDAWTTIEALPPVSSMTPLDPLTRTAALPLQWSGTDPGGSGISGFDVEYRAGASGIWTRLLTQTTSTTASFPPLPGQSYAFRVRAIDNAGNVEAWASGDGDAQATLYSIRASGHIYDVLGAPLQSALMTLDRGGDPMVAWADAAGLYSALAITATPRVTVGWSMPGYTALPGTVFSIAQDMSYDVYLPPGDNLVRNWGFEALIANGADWLKRGLPIAQSETARHTGLKGISLGGTRPSEPQNVSRSSAHSFGESLALDPTGAPHAVWLEGTGAVWNVKYANREFSGEWATPLTLTGQPIGAPAGDAARNRPAIGIDASGITHVAWRDVTLGAIHYARRDSGGNWSSPQIVVSGLNTSTGALASTDPVQLAVSAGGEAHLVWHNTAGARSDILYLRRDSNGAWAPIETITAGEYGSDSLRPVIAVDGVGVAHVAWQNGVGYYSQRPPGGAWSRPAGTTIWPFLVEQSHIALDNTGAPQLAWVGHGPGGVNAIVYAKHQGGSFIGTQLAITSAQPVLLDAFIVDAQAKPHMTWSTPGGSAWHITPAAGNAWTATQFAAPVPGTDPAAGLAATTSGVWVVAPYHVTELRCWKLTLDAVWHDIGTCNGWASFARPPRLLTGPDNRVNLLYDASLWNPSDPREVAYGVWDDAAPGGASIAQALTLPLTGATRGLSFMYQLGIPNGEAQPVFTATIEGALGATEVFTARQSTGQGWAHVWRDVSAWAGQVATLTFSLDPLAGAGTAQVFIDEVSLGSIPADVWLTAASAPARPGGQTVLQIALGNRGAGLASGAVLTAALPSGLTFVSAEPEPVSTSPLIWHVPDLPAGAGPFAIAVTATIAPEHPSPAVLTVTLELSTPSMELDLTNNQVQTVVWVGYLVFIPLITLN